MNTNLDNTPLDDLSAEDIEALAKADETVVEAATESASEEVATDDADTAEDAASDSTVVAAASAPAPVRKVGRPYDSAGKTKLGQARLLYADNPDLAVKELKSLFETKLGIKASVAQTYASLVRRKTAST